MSFLESISSLNVFNRPGPFSAFSTIQWRARHLLKNRSHVEQVQIAQAINEVVEAYKEDQTDLEMDQYVDRLCANGGWELAYWEGAESGFAPTRADIVGLLNNWPRWAPDKPDLPSPSDINDFDALQDILDTDVFQARGYGISATRAELFGILTLVKLDTVAGMLRKIEGTTDSGLTIYHCRGPWESEIAIAAGNLLIEAMEIICCAERELIASTHSPLRGAEAPQPENGSDIAKAMSTLGRRGADASHVENRAMKNAVYEWCDMHMAEFRSMDSAAEAIAGKVVPVTFRTVRNWIKSWKKNKQSAGTL